MRKVCAIVILIALVGISTWPRQSRFDDDDVPKPANPAGPPGRMDLQGRTAVVTGSAIRVGRQICLELAKKGANVVVNYRSSAGQAAKLVEEMVDQRDLQDPRDSQRRFRAKPCCPVHN